MRAFWVTAEEGSLSAAARRLGTSQPTISRQVAALEDALGIALFERVGKRMVLTQAGSDVLAHACNMGSAAELAELTATGGSQNEEGLVSISASDGIAAHVLPSIISRLRTQAPGIHIDIIAVNTISDLRRREADIAIRHVRPEDPDLIARLLRETTAHFYASRRWVARHGIPVTPDDASRCDFIGFGRDSQVISYLRDMGIATTAANFPVSSANSVTAWNMACADLGICIMMEDVASQFPDMVRVLEGVPSVTFPIWLVTHRELHTARRIRIIFDGLADALGYGV